MDTAKSCRKHGPASMTMEENEMATSTSTTESISERVRLTLELSAQLSAELDRLAVETGRTKADLLRLGVDLLSKAAAARREGGRVGAWWEDDQHHIRKEREFVAAI